MKEEEIVRKEERLLDSVTIRTLKQELLQVMEQEKPYLDIKLTIHQLAKQAKTNTKYLSYILNTEFEKNFVTFINDFRIREAQSLLTNPLFENYTIEAIGEMAGFNSKSSFNMAFKKCTNSTPSKFRKNNMC